MLRDDVKKAIRHRFEACLPSMALRPDRTDYTRAPSDNLLPFLDATLLHDFADGDGSELEGELPKFCAAHSSSALAANSFGVFRFDPTPLDLAGIRRFTEARFERKLPTGLPGNPPNLDFFADGPGGTVVVESKFTEFLTPKMANFAESYSCTVNRLADPAWAGLFDDLLKDPRRFRFLDAAQLVKHYLGMRHSLRDGERPQVLVYVFWEPANSAEFSDFREHRAEVEVFSSLVSGSEVGFVGLSYPELWTAWEEADSWAGSRDHVAALRARYGVTVPTPAT